MSTTITTTPYCFSCQHTPAPGDPPLQRCGGCRSRHYCSQACQRTDWSDHKPECRALAQGAPVPERRRQTFRIQGFPGVAAQAGNDDKIYYLKSMLPHIHDISLSGPYADATALAHQMEHRLTSLKSVDGVHSLRELVESDMLQNTKHFNAPLPDGNILRFEIEHERNAEAKRGIPGPLYFVYSTVPMLHLLEGRQGDTPPVEKLETHGTFLNRAAAERRLREVVEEIKQNIGGAQALELPVNNGNDVANWAVYPVTGGRGKPHFVQLRFDRCETR